MLKIFLLLQLLLFFILFILNLIKYEKWTTQAHSKLKRKHLKDKTKLIVSRDRALQIEGEK